MSSREPIPAELEARRAGLFAHLRTLPRLLVAYSGGVDSAYLAWAAHEVHGDDMLAVIADSPSLARTQLDDAVALAAVHGIPVRVLPTGELGTPDYVRNDSMRCFHCKNELFETMERFRSESGYGAVAYGVNLDDQGDWRPGQQAARKHGVAAPLLDALLTKIDIRTLAAAANLRVWDKPASACLSSRIEYGRPVTTEALRQVEEAEEFLRKLGLRQFRVRHHGDIARIEVARDEMSRVLDADLFARIASALKGLGFKFVALDMEGFRSGSMNALLKPEEIAKPSRQE